MGVEGLFHDGLLLPPCTTDLVEEALLGGDVLLGLAAVLRHMLMLRGHGDHGVGIGGWGGALESVFVRMNAVA